MLDALVQHAFEFGVLGVLLVIQSYLNVELVLVEQVQAFLRGHVHVVYYLVEDEENREQVNSHEQD
jgi:hypothetical protein